MRRCELPHSKEARGKTIFRHAIRRQHGQRGYYRVSLSIMLGSIAAAAAPIFPAIMDFKQQLEVAQLRRLQKIDHINGAQDGEPITPMSRFATNPPPVYRPMRSIHKPMTKTDRRASTTRIPSFIPDAVSSTMNFIHEAMLWPRPTTTYSLRPPVRRPLHEPFGTRPGSFVARGLTKSMVIKGRRSPAALPQSRKGKSAPRTQSSRR